MRRPRRKKDEQEKPKTSLEFNSIRPLTVNQARAFDGYISGKNLMLHGSAGTGKTLLSLYLALKSILCDNEYKKLIIVRSVVPTRDMGFLPGSASEKSKVYEAPYISICQEIFGRGDAYDILKQKKIVEFMSTSFIRGITMLDSIIIVDEIQNLTSHEANSIITRVGRNCRVIFSGDIRQTDLNKGREQTGLYDFMKIIKRMKSFEHIEFTIDDVCRGNMVKEYLMIRNKLEDDGEIESLSRN